MKYYETKRAISIKFRGEQPYWKSFKVKYMLELPIRFKSISWNLRVSWLNNSHSPSWKLLLLALSASMRAIKTMHLQTSISQDRGSFKGWDRAFLKLDKVIKKKKINDSRIKKFTKTPSQCQEQNTFFWIKTVLYPFSSRLYSVYRRSSSSSCKCKIVRKNSETWQAI